jgi:hypothetical protein
MIVAAHQPSYLPWLGYLDKMARADLFVVMDDLQYEAQNFQNRNRIKLNQGAGWLTVPLERGHQSDRICDKRIQNHASPREHWQRRHFTALRIHYGRSPFFRAYGDQLAEVYSRPWTRLVDLDLHILELARGWFGITQPVVLASSLGLRGERTERIIDLCRAVGARTYLSGSGGSTGYLDLEALRRAGVTVAWQSFDHPRYQQRYPGLGFIPNLCFLDALFNVGPDCRALIANLEPVRLAV